MLQKTNELSNIFTGCLGPSLLLVRQIMQKAKKELAIMLQTQSGQLITENDKVLIVKVSISKKSSYSCSGLTEMLAVVPHALCTLELREQTCLFCGQFT